MACTEKISRLRRSIDKRLARCEGLVKNEKYDTVMDHFSTILSDMRNAIMEVKREASRSQNKE